MSLLSTVWFDSGRSGLTTAAASALDSLLLSVASNGYTSIVVNGFTDGAPGANHATLSLARAYSVTQYLMARNSSLKIAMNGFGLAPASINTLVSLQASRKVEIWVK
jgi:outer membrane protein OmpA-like peptidoglycan-associated protein